LSRQAIETAEFEPGPDLPSHFRKLLVVGAAQLGPDGYWEQNAYPAGKGEDYIEHATRAPDAYVLRVKGGSMSPAIRSGWLVVEPNTACVPGSFVVVCTDSGRCMVKEFLYERDGEVALASVNDSYGRLTLDRSEIVSLHVIGAIIPPHKLKPW
jgi:phage repressor protein C with HTH and peptisase S24 domain